MSDRFRSLDPGAQAIVGCAALIGYRPDIALLLACSDEPISSTIAAMERACALDLLVVESRSPATYRFRHALTQSAIREALGAPKERLLHARIAAAVEGFPDALSRVEQLAYHWSKAEEPAKAGEYAARAAREAKRFGLTRGRDDI